MIEPIRTKPNEVSISLEAINEGSAARRQRAFR
jgi:hypothetical protein